MNLTKEEQDRLIEIAKENYPVGIEIISLELKDVFVSDGRPYFVEEHQCLYIIGHTVWRANEWAEILPNEREATKETEIPTIAEFLNSEGWKFDRDRTEGLYQTIRKIISMHTDAALKAASEKAKTNAYQLELNQSLLKDKLDLMQEKNRLTATIAEKSSELDEIRGLWAGTQLELSEAKATIEKLNNDLALMQLKCVAEYNRGFEMGSIPPNTITQKLEVGKKYINGYGVVYRIINKERKVYQGEIIPFNGGRTYFHEDGAICFESNQKTYIIKEIKD